VDTQPVSKATVDVVRVSGSPRDRGYQYGCACREQIHKAIEAHLSFYSRYCNLTKTSVLKLASKYMPLISGYSSEVAEEVVGISEGVERSLDEILLLVSYWEILYRYSLGLGCTSVAVTGSMTEGGETFVAQNNDESLEPWGEDFSRVVYSRPGSGPDAVMYAYPGFPGQMGLNSKGIALCVNALVTDEHRIGVPFQVITREVLRQGSIGDAVNAVTRAKRASSGNFLMADENGEIYDVETTPSRHELFYSNNFIVHTNHILSSRLGVKRDVILENFVDTVIRYNRMNRILREMSDGLTVQKLMSAFKDHVNYPNSICRHPDEHQSSKDQIKTADCMIYSTTKRSLWIGRGNPCQAELQTFSLQ